MTETTAPPYPEYRTIPEVLIDLARGSLRLDAPGVSVALEAAAYKLIGLNLKDIGYVR